MSDLKELAKKFRDGGNTYQDYRMFLFKPEELKAYADLLDPPPRFNEAQMALLNGYYAIGVRSIIEMGSTEFISLRGENSCVMGTMYRNFLPEDVQKELPLDLAELLGKDGKE